jgi:hypothetical protein
VPSDGDDRDETVVVDLDLSDIGLPPPRTVSRTGLGRFVRARGTAERIAPGAPAPPAPPAPTAPVDDAPDTGLGLERDPIEVLRMWPHSGSFEDPASAGAGNEPADGETDDADLSIPQERTRDWVPARRTAGTPPHVPAACDGKSCEATIDALRTALNEACLLVQRVVLMPSMSTSEIDERLRELLRTIER